MKTAIPLSAHAADSLKNYSHGQTKIVLRQVLFGGTKKRAQYHCHAQTSQAFLGTVFHPVLPGRPARKSKNWGQARLTQVPACPGSAARRLMPGTVLLITRHPAGSGRSNGNSF